MNFNRLIHDKEKVLACLKETPDDRLVTTKPLKIYIPARFAERGLAQIGVETYIVGIACLVVDDLYYGVTTTNAMWRIEPTSMLKVKIGDESYFEFFFREGSTVLSTLHLVKTDTLVYRIFDELITKAKVPRYLGYAELGKILDSAQKHAGTGVGNNHEITELIVSLIARDPKDRHKYYRSTIKSLRDLETRPPVFIPMRSVQYIASNTMTKIAGSYTKDAIVSSLTELSTRVESVENLLRL